MEKITFNAVGILLCCLFAIGTLHSQPIPQKNNTIFSNIQQSSSQTSTGEVSVDKITTPPRQF